MRQIAIVGTGQTKHVSKRTDVNVPGLVRESVTRALEDAGITIKDIDAIVVASGPVLFEGVNHPEKWVAEACGGYLKPVMRVTSGGSSGASGLLAAYYQIASGLYDTVLAVAYQKQSEGETQYAISSLYDPIYGREYAVGILAFAAAWDVARMESLGHTEEQAAMVAVKSHQNAKNNPYAQLAKDITVDDVLNSRPLVWPIKLLDCPPTSDGACAVILASAEKAKKITRTPAWIKGVGCCAEGWNFADRNLIRPAGGALAAKKAYKDAGITNPRKQIDVAEIYTAFSFEELSHYEILGLCGEGEGGKLMEKGVTQMTGELPVNPSGGVLCSNPIGASAMLRIAEAALQVTGKAGARQVEGAKVALAHSYGGWNSHHTIAILSNSQS